MNWTRGDGTMRCAPWTVAKAFVKGVAGYELWHDKQPAMVGRYPSFKLASDEAEKQEKDGVA